MNETTEKKLLEVVNVPKVVVSEIMVILDRLEELSDKHNIQFLIGVTIPEKEKEHFSSITRCSKGDEVLEVLKIFIAHHVGITKKI